MKNQSLKFLTALAENNSKEWMDANRDWYLDVRSHFLDEVSELLKGLVAIEPGLEVLRPKDCIFRQNRDIRFSSDKRPYKVNLAAYFATGGKKSNGPGYYLHIQPGQSFLAGGIWMPPADVVKKIRREIDYSGRELESILSNPQFSNYFSGMEGEQLKTSPREYEADHPYIHYLRYKSYIVSTPLSDEAIRTGNYKQEALKVFSVMKPFHDFLAKAVEDVEDGSHIL
ncbi:MAG: TIGR02453 family protein [Alphaproteobacteria bacterium]|nr:TIGR02453 family protein [Alphaproteobacteria bacterium]